VIEPVIISGGCCVISLGHATEIMIKNASKTKFERIDNFFMINSFYDYFSNVFRYSKFTYKK